MALVIIALTAAYALTPSSAKDRCAIGLIVREGKASDGRAMLQVVILQDHLSSDSLDVPLSPKVLICTKRTPKVSP